MRGLKRKEPDIIKRISDTLVQKKSIIPDGEKVAIPDFTNMTVGVAGFYGFTDNLTFILNATVYNSVKLDTPSTDLGFDN